MPDFTVKSTGPARNAVAARVVRSWRELTGQTSRGRIGSAGSTLLACSGGADSSALVLAMASLGPAMVVGHIVHDLRAAAEAMADRNAVARLAERAGLRMVEARVEVRARGGNAEGEARRLRYSALARLASEAGCRFVATAHHADDQLETVIMRLLRGAGPSGLGGVAPRRRLARGVTLVRPMLGVTRLEAESVCRAWGWVWSEDATNSDESRVRARLRRRVLPVLREIRPDAAARASRSVELVRAAGSVVEARASEVLAQASNESGNGLSLWRDVLRREAAIVVGAVLREAARRAGKGRGMDRAGRAVVERAARAVRDGVGGRREFRIGRARVWVEASEVLVERRAEA